MDYGVKKIGRLPKATWGILLLAIFPLFVSVRKPAEAAATHPVVNVSATVKPRHIQVGEKARLELNISGDTFIKHVKAPKFNFLPAFLAVPLHSETLPQLKSDKIAVSMAWVYELIPQSVGDFALSDIRFDYHGDTYFANPGSIRVSGTDTYREALTGGVHQVEVEVDTATPYLNAPLTYTFRYLYTLILPTQGSPTPRLPIFSDFRVEELPSPAAYTQHIRGKTFWVVEHIRKLYPHKTGRIVLEPAELRLPLPQGHKTLKTAPLRLTVQPLPEIGRPPHFNGAVGEYQISAQTEWGWVETGSAMMLSVRISGRGNMETVTAPKLPAITGVVVSGATLSEDSTSTSRAYTYTLIPAHTGTLRIPAIVYAYFNPNRAVYATTQTAPIPLSVRPNPNGTADIETADESWKFWIILLSAVVLVGGLIAGFFWYRTGLKRLLTSIGSRTATLDSGAKAESAEAQPETPLSQAREALTKLAQSGSLDEETAFANALAQTLYRYLEDVLALSQRSIDTAREVCVQAEVSDHILAELVEILTKCDYHRFAPVPLSADERDALIARTGAVIDHIESLRSGSTNG